MSKLPEEISDHSWKSVIGKTIAGTIGGGIVSFIGLVLIMIVFATEPDTAVYKGWITFGILFACSMFLSMEAKNTSKAWRRMLITAGLMAFMLPLSSMIFTAGYVVQNADIIGGMPGDNNQAVAVTAGHTIGALIGGSMISFITGIFGGIVGIIFLVIGFAVGKDPRIVIIHNYDDPKLE